jgi:glycogen phosphorylase
MKVLVNGGLNLSTRDGWWEEAYAPEIGWAIGDDGEYAQGERDAEDADAVYAILEQEVVPEFYARDAAGMPRRWLERMRRSMAALAPTYSSSRMARDYVEQFYLVGAAELRRRTADQGEPAREMRDWEVRLRRHWSGLHIGETSLSRDDRAWHFSVPVSITGATNGHIYTGTAPATRPPHVKPACRRRLKGDKGADPKPTKRAVTSPRS